MSSEDIKIVASVINGVLNPNNEIRNSFVAKLDELRKNTPALLFCLVKLLDNSFINSDENINEIKQTKTVAAVLARKLIVVKEDELVSMAWLEMNKELKDQIKASLLNAFINEKDNNIKLKICDVIIQVANNTYENDENWNELLNIIVQVLQMNLEITVNTDYSQLESTLLIMAGVFSFVFDEMMIHINLIVSAFRCFFNQPDISLRTKTTRAIADIISYCDKKELKFFHEFIFPILETTLKALECAGALNNTNSESNLKYCLKAITDISSSHPVLLKKHFNDLFTLMCKVAENTSFTDENIREMGFEVIINIVERRNNLLAKDENKLKYLLEQLYKYALEMDKEITDEWSNPTTNSYMEEEFIYEEKVSSAFSFIDRLIEHLSCKLMLPYISEIILQLLQNEKDWRFKYVALLSISQVMNYVDDMTTIENIFPTVFNHINDASPKIRYASINCINQMSDSFQPHFQTNYHNKTVPSLLERISTDPILRVQLEALEALNMFISHQTQDQCTIYTQQLLECLFTIFMKQDVTVNLRNEILEAIAEIAATTRENFTPYASRSLNILIEYFTLIYSQKINKSLYGNLIECITLIGEYDMNVYNPLLPNIVRIIVDLTENIPLSKDPIREYLQESLERIIPLLKSNYPGLLPLVVNSVLRLVQTVPDVNNSSIKNSNEETFKIEDLYADQGSHSEPTIQSVPINSIKSSETEDIADSIDLLNTTITALQDLFIPYIESAQVIILPLVNYYINETVRQRAGSALPLIIEIVAKFSNNREYVVNLAKLYIGELIQVIEKEYDNATLSVQLENLGEIVLHSGYILNKEELNLLFSRILAIFDDVEKRRLKLLNKHKEVNDKKPITKLNDDDEPDSDEELLEDLEKDIEEIEQIQSDIGDVIGFLFKTHKEISSDFVYKLITELLPKYFREGASSFEIKMGIFITDDMIEYLGQEYLGDYWTELAKVIIKFCNSNDCSTRQAASYGVGVFVQHTHKDFHLFSDDCLIALNKALAFLPDESNEEEWGLARDNAAAALGKIIKHQSASVNSNLILIINQWLRYLPIIYDKGECPEQHELLCDIFLNKPELILGENFSNLNNLLRIFAKIYNTKYSVKIVDEKIEQIFILIKNDQNLLSLSLQILKITEDDGKIKKKLSKLLS